MNARGCIHCAQPDDCLRVCDRCACLACQERREAPDAACLTCVRFVGRLGLTIRDALAQIARDRGTTMTQARADLLAAYHRHHDGGLTHD